MAFRPEAVGDEFAALVHHLGARPGLHECAGDPQRRDGDLLQLAVTQKDAIVDDHARQIPVARRFDVWRSVNEIAWRCASTSLGEIGNDRAFGQSS